MLFGRWSRENWSVAKQLIYTDIERTIEFSNKIGKLANRQARKRDERREKLIVKFRFKFVNEVLLQKQDVGVAGYPTKWDNKKFNMKCGRTGGNVFGGR